MVDKESMKLLKWIFFCLIFSSITIFSQTGDEPQFKVIPLPGNINTENQEFGPSLSADGKILYFYSKRNSQYTDLYKSTLNNGRWSDPVEMKSLNSSFDDQSPYVYGNEEFIIFSSNRDGSLEFRLSNGQIGVSRDLYYSESINGKWSKPFSLADKINTDEMEENPFVHGSNLYFTRYPFGNPSKSKIYKSKIISNNFMEPEELPSPINLAESSNFAAVVSADGKYLYFSSDRAGGYGGYDIYRSKINTDGSYGEPENLGSEINTDGNEAYLIVNPSDNSLLFCRKKVTGSYDIYVAKKLKEEKEETRNEVAVNRPSPSKPITDDPSDPKKISKLDPKTNPTNPKTTDSGKKNPIISNPKDHMPEIKKPESPKTELEKITETLKDKKKLTLSNINFEINSSDLLPESIPLLSKVAEYLLDNKNLKIKVTGHTDLTGDQEFNKQLSWDRAESVKKFFITKGIASAKIVTEGKGSSQPIIADTKAESNKINRRTEFEIID
jgi:outer membrane protein OmpA-like peptidoglycan-associated protein